MESKDTDESKPLPAAVIETAAKSASSVAHGVGSGLKSAARAAGAALQSLGETAESVEAREAAERLQQETIETLAEVKEHLSELTAAKPDEAPKRTPRSKTAAAKPKASASTRSRAASK